MSTLGFLIFVAFVGGLLIGYKLKELEAYHFRTKRNRNVW